MTGTPCDIPLFQQIRLVYLRIELRFHAQIRRIPDPALKVLHRLLRPIGIKNIQLKPGDFQGVLYLGKRFSRRTREDATRLTIAINLLADKIVCRAVTQIQPDTGNDLVYIDKAFRERHKAGQLQLRESVTRSCH